MTLFPTEQWLERYADRLDRNDALDDVAAGWGENVDGDVRFVIEDLPLADTTIGDLPDSVLEALPEPIRDGVADVPLAEAPDTLDGTIRPSLPDHVCDLLVQIEDKTVDGAVHAHVGLEAGRVTDAEVLDTPEARSAGVVIRGPLTTWQRILDGRPAASAILTGDLTVEGHRIRLLRYAAMLQLLGDVAADVETTHLFEPSRQQFPSRVVDVAARPSAAIHRSAERQAAWALRTIPTL